MNDDVADGVLPDVRGFSMTDLLAGDDESGFATALDRLLASNKESNYNSFGSSI
jgi:hypothetical protein